MIFLSANPDNLFMFPICPLLVAKCSCGFSERGLCNGVGSGSDVIFQRFSVIIFIRTFVVMQ